MTAHVLAALRAALSLVTRAQDVLEPIVTGASKAHEDFEVSDVTAQLVGLCDQQLQETRDDLTKLVRALEKLPLKQREKKS